MNLLREKEISVTYGLPGVDKLITKTGKFKEMIGFSEGVEFLIITFDNTDLIINLSYIISWSVKDPPSTYTDIYIKEVIGEYIQ